MTRRDHIIVAVVAATALIALAVLGTVVDVSPHAWVSAVFVVSIITFGLAALFLIGAVLSAAWIAGDRWTRRLIRRTVRRQQMAPQRSGGSVRRRHPPTSDGTMAARPDPFTEYAANFAIADEVMRVGAEAA